MAKKSTGVKSKVKVEQHRAHATSAASVKPARTGAELLGFLRLSPFVGEDFVIERDRSVGRRISLT